MTRPGPIALCDWPFKRLTLIIILRLIFSWGLSLLIRVGVAREISQTRLDRKEHVDIAMLMFAKAFKWKLVIVSKLKINIFFLKVGGICKVHEKLTLSHLKKLRIFAKYMKNQLN